MQGNSWNFRFSNEKQLHNTFVSGYILLRSSDSFFLICVGSDIAKRSSFDLEISSTSK